MTPELVDEIIELFSDPDNPPTEEQRKFTHSVAEDFNKILRKYYAEPARST